MLNEVQYSNQSAYLAQTNNRPKKWREKTSEKRFEIPSGDNFSHLEKPQYLHILY